MKHCTIDEFNPKNRILISKKYNTFMTKVWKVYYKKHLRLNQNSITFIMTFKIISNSNVEI